MKKSTKITLIYIFAALIPSDIIMFYFTTFVIQHLKQDKMSFTFVLNIVMVLLFTFLILFVLFFLFVERIDFLGYDKAKSTEDHLGNLNQISEMLDENQLCIVDYTIPNSNTDFEFIGSIIEHYNLTYFAKLESDSELVTIIVKDNEKLILKAQVTPEYFLKRFS